jgi:hypothetical protein
MDTEKNIDAVAELAVAELELTFATPPEHPGAGAVLSRSLLFATQREESLVHHYQRPP